MTTKQLRFGLINRDVKMIVAMACIVILPTRSFKYIFLCMFSSQYTNMVVTCPPHYSLLSFQSVAHWKHFISPTASVYLQGHSTLLASQDFSTLLTWMAGTNSPKTVNAAATTPRKSKSRIASQVQDGGTGQGRSGWTLQGRPRTEGC